MSSPATPFINIDTEPLSPDSTDYFITGESPIKPGREANEYLAAPTIPKAMQHTFLQLTAPEQDTNRSTTRNQRNGLPSTPVVQIVSGSTSPTTTDDAISSKLRNDTSSHMAQHLNLAFSSTTPSQGLLTPTGIEQSVDSIPPTTIPSRRATFRPGPIQRCISPTLSSRRSIVSSLGRDQSIGSYSSSDYLTPPLFQADYDKSPFIPLLGDRNSLTMMGLRRVKTDPSGDEALPKPERTRKRRARPRKKRASKFTGSSLSSQSRNQMPSATPSTMPHKFHGSIKERTVSHTSRRNTQSSERSQLTSSSRLSQPRIARRWSSVEIGSHQRPLASRVPLRIPQYSFMVDPISLPVGVPTVAISRYTGSTGSSAVSPWTIEQDILETVQERLTAREIEQPISDMPFSITVSKPRKEPHNNQPKSIRMFVSKDIEEFLSTQPPVAAIQRRSSMTYLLTTKDIECITDLIAANIEARYNHQGKRTPPRSRKAKSDLSAKDNNERFVKASATASDYLQVGHSKGRKSSLSLSRKDSFRSTEMVWQEGPSSHESSSFFDEASRATPKSNSSHITPERRPSEVLKPDFRQDEGFAFDPQNAETSINKWQNDIPLVITSSEDDNCGEANLCTIDDKPESSTAPSEPHSKERQKRRPFLRYQSSATTLKDVESFPPLPQRKMTADWHSPLPEMETITPGTPSEISSSRKVTPKASQMSWARSAQLSPTQLSSSQATPSQVSPNQTPSNQALPGMSVEFSWNMDAALTSPEQPSPSSHQNASPLEAAHHKSVVKHHPSATPRAGSAASMGSSLGVGNHERRRAARPPPPAHTKTPIFPPEASSPAYSGFQIPSIEGEPSSASPIRRVRTIDNARKGEHRAGCSKWRAPSVCPLPQAPSPSEFEDALPQGEYFRVRPSSSTMPVTTPSHLELIQCVVHRKTSDMRDMCPPSVKVDQVGIYGQITRVGSDLSVEEGIAAGRDTRRGYDCDSAVCSPGEREESWCGLN